MEQSPQNIAEKLQQELAMRRKYYFKGFGAVLQGLLADLDYFVNCKAEPQVEEHAREMLGKIVSCYQSISFEQITHHPDYDLLSEIKEAISKLVPEVEVVLSGGGPDKSYEIIEYIAKKGQEYRARLKALLNELNSQPGHEKDGFRVVDINGKVWSHPF